MSRAKRDTIAIVDDDEAVRHALGFLLDVLGRCSEGFPTAAEFIAAGPAQFGGVILDQHMPGMSGLDLARRLLLESIDIPIMLMSGNLTPGVVDKAVALGVTWVSEKPVDMDDLSAFLDEMAR